jgi:hypothetical protein
MGSQAKGFLNNTYRFMVSEGLAKHHAQLERSSYFTAGSGGNRQIRRIINVYVRS